MSQREIDILAVDRGAITAPAGCGKTHLIAEALSRHRAAKPMLVLTHTNAGVAALRLRLDRAKVPRQAYQLMTIDGWAIRLISTFPLRSGHDPRLLQLDNPRTQYPAIRTAAALLLKAGHINDVIAATHARLFVDEYQDCSIPQHALIYFAAHSLPTCVLGDPMQAIFRFQGNQLADWQEHVCAHFPVVGELNQAMAVDQCRRRGIRRMAARG
jgi:ATP-dependent exoDNAse (exonuclease V) beta subunit